MLLIELVIVIIFFSLSQVVLVQVFAGAQSKTKDSERLNFAMLSMQDIAEQLSNEQDPDSLLRGLGFSGENGQYVYSTDRGVDLFADVQRVSHDYGQMLTVELRARQGEKELFVFPSVRYFPSEVQP